MITQDWRHATPEQKNFWNLCNGLIAWDTITPLYYQGAIAGSEFLTYAATKLYIALEFSFSTDVVISPGDNIPFSVSFYNVANALNCTKINILPFYDGVGLIWQLTGFPLDIGNICFSRIVAVRNNYMTFNGYRLNVV